MTALAVNTRYLNGGWEKRQGLLDQYQYECEVFETVNGQWKTTFHNYRIASGENYGDTW